MRIHITALLFVMTGALGLTGCAALLAGGAAGAGTLAYIKGELHERLPASTSRTRKAIADAVQRLELKELKAEADNLSGDYVLRTGKDEKMNVRYEKVDDRLTDISIRVGLFGDENLSRALLTEIKKGL